MPIMPNGSRRDMKVQQFAHDTRLTDRVIDEILEKLAATGIADPVGALKDMNAPIANQPVDNQMQTQDNSGDDSIQKLQQALSQNAPIQMQPQGNGQAKVTAIREQNSAIGEAKLKMAQNFLESLHERGEIIEGTYKVIKWETSQDIEIRIQLVNNTPEVVSKK